MEFKQEFLLTNLSIAEEYTRTRFELMPPKYFARCYRRSIRFHEAGIIAWRTGQPMHYHPEDSSVQVLIGMTHFVPQIHVHIVNMFPAAPWEIIAH